MKMTKQMAVLEPFLAIFWLPVCLSFTKLRFRRSFWCAEWVKIPIGSKVMAKNANVSISQTWLTYKKIASDKWPCNDHTWPFFANYMFIFHKTEIQTVILRCLTSLNLGTKVIPQFEYGSTAHLHKHGGKNNALYTQREHRIIVSRFMHSIINS